VVVNVVRIGCGRPPRQGFLVKKGDVVAFEASIEHTLPIRLDVERQLNSMSKFPKRNLAIDLTEFAEKFPESLSGRVIEVEKDETVPDVGVDWCQSDPVLVDVRKVLGPGDRLAL